MNADRQQDCARCPDPILRGQLIVPTPRGWIHASCANGADDE